MTSENLYSSFQQIPGALAFYVILIALTRLAGKRFAGQTATIDLIVLISLAATVQESMLAEGWMNAIVFVTTVFGTHKALAAACNRWQGVRSIVRGRPRALVRDGVVLEEALEAEHVTHDELLAGLRRLGYAGPAEVRLAVLEETGHISAVGIPRAADGEPAAGGAEQPGTAVD